MQTVSYMGDGTTTEFTFNFPYYENSNVIVTINESVATGYSIVGTSGGADADIPNIGGKVVFETAPRITDIIKITRHLPLERIVDYQPTEKIDPTILNQDANYLMEVIKDRKDELEDLTSKYAEIADKEATDNLLEKIDAVDEQISNFEDEIEAGKIMSKNDFYSYTTNCITKIPQDIKLELNNGTLTLKKGSKIYIPNGTGVFDTIDITSDKTTTINTNGQYYIVLNPTDGYLNRGNYPASSGSTAPETSNTADLWYDTTNNLVKRYSSGTWSKMSFPIAIVTVSNGAISSIDQVFNGFGYIGSTVFALPGVEGLIPDGRNADGSLKNNVMNISSVQIRTFSGTATYCLFLNISGLAGYFQSATIAYDTEKNINYRISNNEKLNNGIMGSLEISAGQITSFLPKKVFNLL